MALTHIHRWPDYNWGWSKIHFNHCNFPMKITSPPPIELRGITQRISKFFRFWRLMFVQILGLNIDHFPSKMPCYTRFILKFVFRKVRWKITRIPSEQEWRLLWKGQQKEVMVRVGGFLKTCCFEKHHQSAVLTVWPRISFGNGFLKSFLHK